MLTKLSEVISEASSPIDFIDLPFLPNNGRVLNAYGMES